MPGKSVVSIHVGTSTAHPIPQMEKPGSEKRKSRLRSLQGSERAQGSGLSLPICKTCACAEMSVLGVWCIPGGRSSTQPPAGPQSISHARTRPSRVVPFRACPGCLGSRPLPSPTSRAVCSGWEARGATQARGARRLWVGADRTPGLTGPLRLRKKLFHSHPGGIPSLRLLFWGQTPGHPL